MKGIVLAGGAGTRLHPITRAVSKQLLPVYDKPMIYYPLSVLMLGGIREILLISAPPDRQIFEQLLGDGSHLGLRIDHAVQPEPNGLAEAFVIGAGHIGTDSVALVLGDNIFHGSGLSLLMAQSIAVVTGGVAGCVLFGYPVPDPRRYGVAEADADGKLLSIEEKPAFPRSNRAVTGLYLYDNEVVDVAARLEPSARGELEVTDINRDYLARGRTRLVDLGRGFAWLDTGTHESLLDAGEYVRVIQNRQGIRIACLEEIALRMGFIDPVACYELGERAGASSYGAYVMDIAKSFTP
jgi:glucose-1-phosphate thymidylyltransferase